MRGVNSNQDIHPADRSSLIERVIKTLRNTLFEEMLIVPLVIGLFLLHVRSALIAIVTLPVAVLLAFIPMYYQGLTANIMSLGGIAVAIGAMFGFNLSDVIVEGASQRIRPMLMTGITLFAGLLPIMYSTGSGADVMKRIAAPMLGAAGSALLLVLVVFPTLYSFWRGRGLAKSE